MADEALVKEYRKLRRKHATLGARDALRWARALAKPLEFDWKGNPGRHANAATTTADGFDIRIIVDYDPYADPRASYSDKDTGIRNPDFQWNDGDTWPYRNDDKRGKRYIELESGYTVPELAEDYHNMGFSKSVALDMARASLWDEAKPYLSEYGVTNYIVRVEASLAGIDLGDSSLGGIEAAEDYNDEREIEDAVKDHDLIGEAVEDARKSLAKLSEAVKIAS